MLLRNAGSNNSYRTISAASALTLSLIVAEASAANSSATDAPGSSAASGDAIAEIVVTAQRRAESLLSVPIAVTAVTGDELAKQGIVDTSDLAMAVPNLEVNSAYGKSTPNFSLRGISVGNEFNANQASPVGVYVDDAYLAARILHGAQLFDLDRIEVLRGPQGTLFGRNTTGGAINMITRAPKLGEDSGYAEVGYGNFHDYRFQGAAEHTFVPSVFGIRAAVDYEKSDGLFKNVYPGGLDPNAANVISGRIEARYTPTDQWDIQFKVYGSDDRSKMTAVFGIGIGPNGANPITGYTRSGLGFFTVDENQAGRSPTSSYGTTAKIQYKPNESVTLYSLTSYDFGIQRYTNDADGTPISLLATAFSSDVNELNQEFHVSYSQGPLDAIAGVYYGQDTIQAHNEYDLLFFLEGFGLPADPTFTAGGGGIRQAFRQTRHSEAIFAQLNYKFTDHLALTGGVRYSWDQDEYANGRAYITGYDGTPLVSTIPGPGPYTTTPLPTLNNSTSAPTGRVALTYTFDGGQIAYASFNRGYRSGTYSGSGYLSPAQVYFVQPETVNAFELGAKGAFFNRRMTVSAAAFYYDYKNQQIENAVGIVDFLKNAGKSKVEGVEAELTGVVSHAITLRGSATFLSTRYDDLTLSNTNLAGNELPFAPKTTAQFAADWKLAEFSGSTITFTPSVRYTGREFFTPYNAALGNEGLQQKATTITNASLAWDKDHWSARLWVNNLANTQYYLYGFSIQSLGFNYFTPSLPRTFGVAVRYKW